MPINNYIDTVFAEAGDLTPVPDAVQGDGSVSYDQGYGIKYSTPVGSGGLDFPRAQLNQLLNDITTVLQQYQQHGTPPFITSTMNGGTPYSYSQYDRALTGGVAYQSLINGNTDTPPTSNWAVVNIGVTNNYIAATTTGSANAQIAGATTPVATSFVTGQSVTCVAGFTNTGSMTFGAGGETPVMVKKNTASGLVALTGNEIVAGNKLIFIKDTAASCWVIESGALYLQPQLNLGDLLNASTALTNIGIIFSLSTNGYVKIGTLIIQYATFTVNSSGFTTWTFPTAFPNNLFQVYVTPRTTAANVYAGIWNSGTSSTSGASVAVSTGSSIFATTPTSVLAIGN